MSRTGLVLLAVSLFAGCRGPDPHSALVRDFEKRVAGYVRVHNAMEAKLPELRSTTVQAKIAGHRQDLAGAIKAARRAARQGDIFTPEIAAEFRRMMAVAMQGAEAARVNESLRNGSPVALKLVVNDRYPEDAPLQSMPSTLLLNLPQLPPEVDYRLSGQDLVLRDVKANLVVDMVPDVMP
jgi:hypothetical protein